jgi:uncharacterized Zn finger protein (UPF0148 family)
MAAGKEAEKAEKKLKEMADLLLSRATMLEVHCGTCHYPLFEKEGKVLCPNCGILDLKREDFQPQKAGERGKGTPPEETPSEGKPTAPEPSTPLSGDGLGRVLEEKRGELLTRLREEKNLGEILSLLEALEKISRLLDSAPGRR